MEGSLLKDLNDINYCKMICSPKGRRRFIQYNRIWTADFKAYSHLVNMIDIAAILFVWGADLLRINYAHFGVCKKIEPLIKNNFIRLLFIVKAMLTCQQK